MNWTGGRLYRHSKANSNSVVKAQKDYFARARLRHSIKPSLPTPLHVFVATAGDQEHYSHRSRGEKRRQASPENEPSHSNSRVHQAAHPEEQAHLQSRGLSVRDSSLTTSPRVNTLEHVRRSLLKQSDWLSLAPARPLKKNSKPSADSKRVARRRRVTREDRERQKHGADHRRVEHNLIKPFVQKTVARQPTDSENASIRIGSNIHQSQAIKSIHRSENLASAISQSSSNKPMLLDIIEAQTTTEPMKDPGPYYLVQQESNGYMPGVRVKEQEAIDDEALIPLEKARGFANFDNVNAHSSSTKQISLSSLSMSRAKLQAYERNQIPPLQHTSSSLIRARPGSSQGMSSDHSERGKEYKFATVDSEPPRYLEYQEDVIMNGMQTNLPPHNPVQASHGQIVTTSEQVSGRNGRENAALSSRPHVYVSQDSRERVNAFHELGRTPDQRNGLARDDGSTQHQKAPYTIERQVQLEQSLTYHNENSMRAESEESGQSRKYPGRRSYGNDGKDRSGGRSSSASYGMMLDDQDSPRQMSIAGQSPAATGRPRRQGDENEAWMRDVFSTDFHKLQQRFSFARAPAGNSGDQAQPLRPTSRKQRSDVINRFDQFCHHERTSNPSSESSLSKSTKVVANARLHIRQDTDPNLQSLPSETDLLTQMRPMTDYFDDRIFNMSTYNDASRTLRSFVEAPSISQKRSASDAFGDDPCDQYDDISPSGSKGQNVRSPAMHRIPLDTLHQRLLRANSRSNQAPVLRRNDEDIPRFVWRRAKALPHLKINRAGQSFVSNERSQAMQAPRRHGTRFPLDYMPMRTSTNQENIKSRLGGRPQALHIDMSNYGSQLSSPTAPPQHRVPLSSRNNIRVQDNEHHAQHRSIAQHVKDGNIFKNLSYPSSSQYANAPTSSNSSVPSHNGGGRAANVHTNDGKWFVFERPQRPAAQFAHPSRGTQGFRFLAPVPLH